MITEKSKLRENKSGQNAAGHKVRDHLFTPFTVWQGIFDLLSTSNHRKGKSFPSFLTHIKSHNIKRYVYIYTYIEPGGKIQFVIMTKSWIELYPQKIGKCFWVLFWLKTFPWVDWVHMQNIQYLFAQIWSCNIFFYFSSNIKSNG